jgi:glycosyltransferase involved in cell wall biosynthesis
MNRLIICNFYPNRYSGGHAILCWETIKEMSPKNTTIYVIKDSDTQGNISDINNFKIIESKYVSKNSILQLKNYSKLSFEIKNIIEKNEFMEILLFCEKSLFSLPKVSKKINVKLIIGDPFPKVINHRFLYNVFYKKNRKSIIKTFNYAFGIILSNIHFLIKSRSKSSYVNTIIFSGAQHLQFWKLCGFKNLKVNNALVKTLYPEGLKKKRKNMVILMGKLAQIENLFAQHFLADKFFPYFFSKDNIPKDLKFHIIGNNKGLITKLADIINLYKSRIILEGFVDDIDFYWYNSKILFVPTITKLGVRTRIFAAFSKGCVVLCHTSCKGGIPFLKDNINCLMGKNHEELSMKLNMILNDNDLYKKIQHEAYKTVSKLIYNES